MEISLHSIHLVLRQWNCDNDTYEMANVLNASEQADHLNRHISGEDLRNAFETNPNCDLQRDVILAEASEKVVGYGRVARVEELSCVLYKLTAFLAPEWRRKGIGWAILGWQEQRARQIAVERPSHLPDFFHINATQYQVGLHALARQAGYEVKESWVLMVRPNLDHIPDIPLPEGLEVRPAQPEDFHDIFFAIQEAYVPEGGPPPNGKFPQDFIDSPLFQPDLWQVAWDRSSGKVAGSVCGYINHAENKQMGILRGYTEDISTVPSWRKRGVATALIYRSLKAQRDRGMTESALACNAEKHDNYRLYDGCGFKEVKRDTVYRKKLESTFSVE